MVSWIYILGWFPTTAAIIGNALVVTTIATRKRLHTAPNCFVMSLAVVDLCVGLFYFPTFFFCQYLALCKNIITNDLAVLAIYLSNANLCAMTADRYLAIVKPLRYTIWLSFRRVAFFIAVAWSIPIIVDFLPALCARFGKCDGRSKGVILSRMVLFEIAPCLFVLVTTIQIIRAARKHARQDALLHAQLQFNMPGHPRNKEPSSASVIVTVVAIFLACYCVELYSVFGYIIGNSSPSQDLVNVIVLLVIINSAANPIAYALFKKDIRKELKVFFRRSRGRVVVSVV